MTATITRADTPDSFRLIVDIPEADVNAATSLEGIQRVTQAYVAALGELGISATESVAGSSSSAPERAWGVFSLLGMVIGFTLLLAVMGGVAWLAIEAWSAVIP